MLSHPVDTTDDGAKGPGPGGVEHADRPDAGTGSHANDAAPIFTGPDLTGKEGTVPQAIEAVVFFRVHAVVATDHVQLGIRSVNACVDDSDIDVAGIGGNPASTEGAVRHHLSPTQGVGRAPECFELLDGIRQG